MMSSRHNTKLRVSSTDPGALFHDKKNHMSKHPLTVLLRPCAVLSLLGEKFLGNTKAFQK